MQECNGFMSSDQFTLHIHCAMAYVGSLFDEESTPQFPPLMKSICSLPFIRLTLRMLMEPHFEKESTSTLIGSQAGTINFIYVATRKTAAGLVGWVSCCQLSTASQDATPYIKVFDIEFFLILTILTSCSRLLLTQEIALPRFSLFGRLLK